MTKLFVALRYIIKLNIMENKKSIINYITCMRCHCMGK